MGLYLAGVEFPENCSVCDLLYDCCRCIVTGRGMDFERMDFERLPDCPAAPAPPSGADFDAWMLWTTKRLALSYEDENGKRVTREFFWAEDVAAALHISQKEKET